MNTITVWTDGYEHNGGYVYELETICPICKKKHTMTIVDKDDSFIKNYNKWKDGALVQDAFPNFTPSQREFLITGICDKC